MEDLRTYQIYINDAFNVDCAVIVPEIGVTGKSWSIDIKWLGYLDNEEVVFDFSAAKKSAKSTIENFMDHKLMVPKSIVREAKDRILLISKCSEGYFSINSYWGALCILEDKILEELQNNITIGLEKRISEVILNQCPTNIIEVSVELKGHPSGFEKCSYFSYLHSLKNHYGGCQRFHGHSSEIIMTKDHILDKEMSLKAADLLNNRYIINKSYLQMNDNSRLIDELYRGYPVLNSCKETHYNIEYTGSEGHISIIMSKERIILLNCESTIENLSLFLLKELNLDNSYKIQIYEGLKKGAIL